MSKRNSFLWAAEAGFFCFLALLTGAAVFPGADGGAEAERWNAAGFVDTHIEYIDGGGFYSAESITFDYTLDFTVVILRNSGWEKKKVLKRLERMARIFEHCGVHLGRIKFVEAGSPVGVVDFGKPGGWDRVIAEKTPGIRKPVLYYFRSIPKYNAFAWIQTQEDDDIPAELRDTAWFSLSVTQDLNEKIRGEGYVSEAHEVGHILMDSLEHWVGGEKNLMGEDYGVQNARLSLEQCERIRRSPLLIPKR